MGKITAEVRRKYVPFAERKCGFSEKKRTTVYRTDAKRIPRRAAFGIAGAVRARALSVWPGKTENDRSRTGTAFLTDRLFSALCRNQPTVFSARDGGG